MLAASAQTKRFVMGIGDEGRSHKHASKLGNQTLSMASTVYTVYCLLLPRPSDYNGFESFVEENGLCLNAKRSNGRNFGSASWWR
jgi:hypothetical protein